MFKLIIAALIMVFSSICFADSGTNLTISNQTNLTYSLQVGQAALGDGIGPNGSEQIDWNQIQETCIKQPVCLINLVFDSGLGDQNIASMFVNVPNQQVIVFVPLDVPGFIMTFDSTTNIINITQAPE